jgi:hypothetical protein
MAKPARELPQLHRPSPVQRGARAKQPPAAATVGAKALARHLDLTHPRIHQLVHEEHVLEQLPDGRFNLDDSRVRYIRWLRDPERRTAKSKVDQDFTQAKAELIRLRIAEKQKVLMLTDEAMEVSEKLIGPRKQRGRLWSCRHWMGHPRSSRCLQPMMRKRMSPCHDG